MSCHPRQTLKILAAGVTALVIAMGISRFAYTPLLPIMQTDAGLADDLAGYLASINYAGYLAGALWMTLRPPRGGACRTLRLHLLVNIASTLAMGVTASYVIWAVLRLVAGFSSAMIFVLASGVVLQHLAMHSRQGWSGWLYSAIGIGIIITALTVPPLGAVYGWRGSWLGMGVLSFLLAYPAYYWLEDHHAPTPTNSKGGQTLNKQRSMLPWLTVAYFCAGFGYIVTGTFIVAMLQRIPELAGSSNLSWLIVGIAAAPSSILWMKYGLRTSPTQALVSAHLLQALGIILPLLWATSAGALLGAFFYGGTFMGIVTLSMYYGRTLTPDTPHRTIGLLTASFGTGQIIGPSFAGFVAARAENFSPALMGADVVVLPGAVLLITGRVLNNTQTKLDRQHD